MKQGIKAQIQISPEKMMGNISPLIYGGFVEFIRDCVNPGINAQFLVDRSFELVGTREKLLQFWDTFAINDLCMFSLEKQEERKGKCLKIEIIDRFDGFVEVRQKLRNCLRRGSYTIGAWLKVSENFQGSMSFLLNGQKEVINRKITQLNSEWKKIECNIQIDEDYADHFSMQIQGIGTIWMDDLSITPSDTVDGVWKGIIDSVDDLNCGIIRFPGGCFADVYDWRDGIGSVRGFKENTFWGGMEDNSFGTDEFLQFCKNVHCEPLICVNFGSGTPELAANWVEYCNGGVETVFGAMRAKNGHSEPYGIHYWEIGNENYGEWEVGNCDSDNYCKKYEQFYRSMKQADPSIDIIACGTNEYDAPMEWNSKLMSLNYAPDLLALHFYGPQCKYQKSCENDIYYGTVGAPVKFERIIKEVAEQIESKQKRARIAVTEWNAMYITNSFRERTMEAAIYNAGMLIVYIRNCGVVEIANFSDLVNGWEGSCIVNDYGNIYHTPSYYVIKLFSEINATQLLQTSVVSDEYFVDEVGHIKNLHVPYVDGIACKTEKGLCLFLINRSDSSNADVTLGNIFNSFANIIVTTISAKPSAYNTFEEENVVPITQTLRNSKPCVTLLPCSVTRILGVSNR